MALKCVTIWSYHTKHFLRHGRNSHMTPLAEYWIMFSIPDIFQSYPILLWSKVSNITSGHDTSAASSDIPFGCMWQPWKTWKGPFSCRSAWGSDAQPLIIYEPHLVHDTDIPSICFVVSPSSTPSPQLFFLSSPSFPHLPRFLHLLSHHPPPPPSQKSMSAGRP